jgi:sugar phosphate isomerase/epimerase
MAASSGARVLGPDDIVLCSGTVKRAPLELTVRAAASAGFDGVSLYHHEYVAALEAGWSDGALRSLVDDLGLAVAELDGRMAWLPGDHDIASVDEMVDAACALGARSITVLETDGRVPDVDLPLDVFAEHYAALADRAATVGLLVHIEYFPFSGIRDLATALEIARRADRPNAGVMVDTWHHVRGPDVGRLDVEAAAPSVLALQVGDVLADPMDDRRAEMMHHRVLPGEGVAPLASLLRALRDHGSTAPVEVEVYSDALAAMDPFDAARLARAAIDRVLRAARPDPHATRPHGA